MARDGSIVAFVSAMVEDDVMMTFVGRRVKVTLVDKQKSGTIPARFTIHHIKNSH